MTQTSLDYTPKLPESRKFDGVTFEPKKDAERLGNQLVAVRDYMLRIPAYAHYYTGSMWHTLREITAATGYPESSVSARLRDLRKPKFGAYTVERRRVSGGIFEYRVSK